MPLCACSNRPCRLPTAPVNAPRTWPNSSASSRVSGIALQLSATKRCDPPRAVVVDGARDDFLAGSGLARDEDRARRVRDGLEQLEHFAHRAAASDDAFEPIPLLKLRAQVRVLGFQPSLFERGFECVEQLFELERLGDEVRRAAPDHVHGVAHRAVAGDDDAR